MTIKTKFGKNFVIFSVAIAIIIGMFGFSTKIYAKEFLNTEIINPVYNENGELIQFTVILKNASPELLEQLYKEVESRNINLMTTEMNKNGVVPLSVTGAGIIKFVQGACVVLAVLSGYGCTDVAHYIGLKLVDGWYMYNGKKYSGEWKVERGYIPGCEPRHSEGCFRTTYTKIG
ncbi:hypothetical protein [Thomasclavelia cocleata]|jgi:hypothetical protein|uniref:Uncharacterized protein n=2 Tax=Thomasclavelia cocleata TaxID=69824 RepID=A0A1I0DLG8_9FIRM|nr:hypothetical protein [Thomasclavelia cocleata]MCI9631600.1 hypothetical protein [Thomasclavelia cocleata]MCR1961279.1 hypothetical protein [Thomasclavelia cocleata]NDO42706.1 hypothetical protein [Thomasclavelia cocleata]PJN80484.1 hypothetical protein CWE04_08660 [Thomasclavelia cocleata]SET33149.1 hypothetical protein SAMN04489758_10698 [Thomasclavelia cocleata]